MDIPNLKNAFVQVSNQPSNTSDLLDILRRLDGIDATVVRIAKGEVLLATRLGEIIGKNVLDLKQGDQVRIRVGGPDSNPVLKVSQPAPQRIFLNASREPGLTQILVPNQPQAAMVVAQRSGVTDITLNANQYSINQQFEVKKGQLISLIYRPDKGQIEIKPANTEQVLKSALTRMLPLVMPAGSDDSLVSLIKIFQSLVPRTPAADTNIPTNTRAPQSDHSGRQPFLASKESTSANSVNIQNASPVDQGEEPSQFVSRLLSMLQLLPKISTLDKTMIQQWARFTNPVKNARITGVSVPENPFPLLKQLPTDEVALRPLLQQLAREISASLQSKNHSASNTELPNNESNSSLARDILKLVEQSLTQHQYQQTSIRYQQEQQQPLNFSLTIPVAEDRSTRPLHIEIRKRNQATATEDSSWDINLSFEFGLLGLISSHIILQGNTLSTTFWASEESTKIKMDQALPEFQQQLVQSGFELGQFFVLAGPAPSADIRERPFYPEALLDIRV